MNKDLSARGLTLRSMLLPEEVKKLNRFISKLPQERLPENLPEICYDCLGEYKKMVRHLYDSDIDAAERIYHNWKKAVCGACCLGSHFEKFFTGLREGGKK